VNSSDNKISERYQSCFLTDPQDTLIRRYFWNRPFIFDEETQTYRPPASAFAPRPKDLGLSVNIEKSLLAAGHKPDWAVDHNRFYAFRLTVGACMSQQLSVESTPKEGDAVHENNPHHADIRGVVELKARCGALSGQDQEKCFELYDTVLENLRKASEVIIESLNVFHQKEKVK
jgi:hypothetical protein